MRAECRQAVSHLIKQQPEGALSFPSKLAQAVSPLTSKEGHWGGAAVAAGARQGPSKQSLAGAWSPMEQDAPA